MTPDKLIKFLRDNASELKKHVSRLKIGDMEIEFTSADPVVQPEHQDVPVVDDPCLYGQRGVPSFGRRDDG